MKKITKNNKGFTLVELIVVIAILGVLSAVLVPRYIQYVDSSKAAADEAMVHEIAHAVEVIAASDEDVFGKSYIVTVSTSSYTVALASTPTTNITTGDFYTALTTAVPTAKVKLQKDTSATITLNTDGTTSIT